MDDDMSACRMTTAEQAGEPRRRRATATLPAGSLPTLQRNALRKIFDRPEFSPAKWRIGLSPPAAGRRHRQQGAGRHRRLASLPWLCVEAAGNAAAQPERAAQIRRSIELAVWLHAGYIIQDTAGHSVEP